MVENQLKNKNGMPFIEEEKFQLMQEDFDNAKLKKEESEKKLTILHTIQIIYAKNPYVAIVPSVWHVHNSNNTMSQSIRTISIISMIAYTIRIFTSRNSNISKSQLIRTIRTIRIACGTLT